MPERITTVIVDTCAIQEVNSDFLGIRSRILPAFYESVKNKGIHLLMHPVLDKEIKKHIGESSLVTNHQNLSDYLKRCTDLLKHADLYDESTFKQIREYGIAEELYKAFLDHHSEAEWLEYPNTDVVFQQYFDNEFPFGSGKKKNEFPDAFIIQSVKDYLNMHPNDILLVVSKDQDWLKAFENYPNVQTVQSIDEAQKKIGKIECILEYQTIERMIRSIKIPVLEDCSTELSGECFELDEYSMTEDLEVNVTAVDLDEEIIPLEVTRERLLIKTRVAFTASGTGEVFDEKNSVWDSEDRDYIFREYADIQFDSGYGSAECEVEIVYDFDDPINSAELSDVRITEKGNILINTGEANLESIDDYDLAIRALREDKGLPRK